ncbi:MAG: zf-HC2 domain-containing protein [Gemmatimonadota bacterium]|nr:zf-HC2 domain-containing protein [Gemmatimonadota bacterium]MDH3426920.1 zf-HC2 domain-containing protein [Gemmatimonadota bacterium]
MKREAETMRCTPFLEGYTEFRDGLLAPAREAEFRAHIRDCPECRRYDRVVGHSLALLAELPQPESSDDFMTRLQHRVYNVDQGVVDSGSNRLLGSAALIGVAAVGVLALFWLPFAASVPVEWELAPVAAEMPSGHLVSGTDNTPSLLSPGPFVVPVSLLDERAPESYLDGELEWLPRKQPGPRAFLMADLR